jgi:hypothetical protein
MLRALHTSWHTVKVSFTHSSLGPSRVTSSSAGVAVTQTMFMSCSGSAKAATIGPGSEFRVSERISVVLTTTVSEMTIAAGTGCTGLSMLSMPADLRKKRALCTDAHQAHKGMPPREEGREWGRWRAGSSVSTASIHGPSALRQAAWGHPSGLVHRPLGGGLVIGSARRLCSPYGSSLDQCRRLLLRKRAVCSALGVGRQHQWPIAQRPVAHGRRVASSRSSSSETNAPIHAPI